MFEFLKFNRLRQEFNLDEIDTGKVKVTTHYPKSKTYPDGLIQTEEYEIKYQRFEVGTDSQVGDGSDLGWDSLSQDEKRMIEGKLQEGVQTSTFSTNEGIKITWMLGQSQS